MALPQRGIPLSRRLVVITVGLLAFGLTMGTFAMTVVLADRLADVMDDELSSIAEQIDPGLQGLLRPGASLSESYRDGFVVIVTRDNAEPRIYRPTSASDTDPVPDISMIDISQQTHPMTVHSVDRANGPAWRILSQPITDRTTGTVQGYFTVALSMRSIDETLSDFTARVLLVDTQIIVLGGLVAYALVKQSLRPLRQIEHTAGAIAAGDLSQRVPEGPLETEMGSLANSLNVMLSHIEGSFEAQRKSEEKMRRFVSDASHELRTPLATVQGYGELDRLGGIPEEELPGAMGRIESEAHRMGGLVSDLLQLARLDEGHPIQDTRTDLTQLAADAVGDMNALHPDRPASLVGLRGGTPGPVVATVDENRIRQVLSNLVGNAIQHTPSGTAVDFAVGADRDYAIVEVRDHGPGVPEEHLPRIFGRFHRVDTSRSRESGGSGLGLAIVAAIVEAHRGTVEALTTPGGGLTIRLSIPLAGTNGVESAPPAD